MDSTIQDATENAGIGAMAATRVADAPPLRAAALTSGPEPSPQVPAEDRPFAVEHLRLDETPGEFTPSARLAITSTLRTCGLVAALDDAGVRTLLALLSCLTPNGEARAAAIQVAEVLGTSEREAQVRLDRLSRAVWRVGPVVLRSGLDPLLYSYAVALGLLANAHPVPEPDVRALPIPPAGREAVVEASRATYAVPRAKAEAAVAEQLGMPAFADSDSPVGQAWRGLLAAGVPKEQAKELVEEYPPDKILRQLEWLPARNAREPARFLVATIKEGYGQPPSLLLVSRKIGSEAPEEPVEPGEEADV
jgi:hypothetical protein